MSMCRNFFGVVKNVGIPQEKKSLYKLLDNFNKKLSPLLSVQRNQQTIPHRCYTTKNRPEVKLVIFDKDGTLICFHTMWVPWSRKFANKLIEATGLKIEDKIFKTIGFCPISEKVLPGVLAEGTSHDIKNDMTVLLKSHGVTEEDSRRILTEIWTEGEHKTNLKPLGDAKTIFDTLKSNNIKVAVITSDNRAGTEAMLNELQIIKDIDVLICGDDPDSIPKPAPDNALRICKQLGVSPENTVMIGDTRTDIKMSKAANLGLTISVLSGVGSLDDLHPDSDYVINDIGQMLPLLLTQHSHSSKTEPICDYF